MVEHQHDESSCLAKEDWVRRLLLVVQDFFANIAPRDNFDLVLALRVADQGYREVRKDYEEVVRCTV